MAITHSGTIGLEQNTNKFEVFRLFLRANEKWEKSRTIYIDRAFLHNIYCPKQKGSGEGVRMGGREEGRKEDRSFGCIKRLSYKMEKGGV